MIVDIVNRHLFFAPDLHKRVLFRVVMIRRVGSFLFVEVPDRVELLGLVLWRS